MDFFAKYGVKIVRYADDFILMGNKIPDVSLNYLHKMLEKMELKINTEKTKRINAKKESFDFLGFSFRYDRDFRSHNNIYYWNVIPSKESEKKLRKNIREYLNRSRHKSRYYLVKGLNPILRGWSNYFTIPKVSYPAKSKNSMSYYLYCSFNRFFRRKSQRKCKLYSQDAYGKLIKYYGLYNLSNRYG